MLELFNFFITFACAVFVAKREWFLSQVILWLSDYGVMLWGLVTSLQQCRRLTFCFAPFETPVPIGIQREVECCIYEPGRGLDLA